MSTEEAAAQDTSAAQTHRKAATRAPRVHVAGAQGARTRGATAGTRAPHSANGRVTYFDWLRGAATVAVVILHMFNKMLTDHTVAELGIPLVISWTELQLLLTRWAVPVFLMITGALLLDPKRTPSWRKVGHYVARMVAVLLVFCPTYTCMSARGVTLPALIDGLGKAFTQGSWDHLWYVYALIGLYLLTPLLQAYVRATTAAEQRTFLLVLALPTLVIPTINFATGAGLVTFVWVTSSLFYYLLGAYAHQHLQLNGRIGAVGIGSFAVTAAAVVAVVLLQGRYPKWLIRPECPLVALWSLFVFLAAKHYLDGKTPPAPVALLSQLSLAVYLIHPLVLIVLYRRLWWMPYTTLPPVVFELAVFGIVLGLTIPIALLLKRIPGFRKIL